MGYRKLENVKSRIEIAALNIGSEDGVQCISARTIAAACDISTHTIYNNFPSMQDLIDAVAFKFDRKHMKNLVDLIEKGLSWQEIFNEFIDEFTQDKIGTLYYISYNNIYGFDPTIENPRAEEFLEVSAKLFDPERKLSDGKLLYLWNHVSDAAFKYSADVIRGYVKDTPENRVFACNLIVNGVNGVIA